MTWDRLLSAEAQARIQQLRGLGWSPEAIAALYGISKRTVYRYLKGELVSVQVGDYATTFLIEEGRTPRRAEPWRKAA